MNRWVIVAVLGSGVAAAEPPRGDPPAAVTMPVVEIKEMTLPGADEASARRALALSRTEVMRCYRRALVKQPKLEGTITMKLEFGTGTATSVGLRGVPSIHACLSAAIKALALPAPSHGRVALTAKLELGAPHAGILGALVPVKSDGFGGGEGTSGTFGYGSNVEGESAQLGVIGHGKLAPAAPAATGQPIVQGELEVAIIRRYLRRSFQKIRGCYEAALRDHPELAGTVTAAFTIAGNGSVQAATASGMPEINPCIADTIRGIEFPRPRKGEVQVRYPLTFHATGAEKP